MNLLFLIGMPASGKTRWGRIVSTHHRLNFIDLDAYIEQSEGMNIASVFEEQGEEYFRIKERRTLEQIIKNSRDSVVACGGGTPVFFNNLQMMKDAGCVVYLDVPINTLAERIKQENEMRPLLKNAADITNQLDKMLEDRKTVYEQANYILKGEEIAITNFEKIISLCINRQS